MVAPDRDEVAPPCAAEVPQAGGPTHQTLVQGPLVRTPAAKSKANAIPTVVVTQRDTRWSSFVRPILTPIVSE